MRTSLCWLAVSTSTLIALAACSPTADPNGFGGGGSGVGTAGTGGAGGTLASTTAVGNGGFGFIDGGPVGAGGMVEPCIPKAGVDDDSDGYKEDEGDCDDCDPNQNPNAVEVVNKPDEPVYDENCNGVKDEVEPPCDADIAVDDPDPLSAARAVELCKMSTGPGDWGVVSAEWVMADGSPPPPDVLTAFHLGHGILSGFGPNVSVRKGARMLGVSSGTARQMDDVGYQDVGGYDKQYTASHPQGFPKESPACPGTITGTPHDAAAVEITIRVPSNAHGFAFDFNFYTYEWPDYVCDQFNDFFVSIMSPIPPNQQDGNISFDIQGNPVSVNNAFIEVCGCDGNPPASCFTGGKDFPCALGNTELIGTGFGFDTAFYDHGATSWLTTKAPVDPGTEMTIRWGAYDSGDGALDSTALVDNWRWIAESGTTVGTIPVPQ
jgi:hypothetical protein